MAIEPSYRSPDRSWTAIAHVLEGRSAVTAYEHLAASAAAQNDPGVLPVTSVGICL